MKKLIATFFGLGVLALALVGLNGNTNAILDQQISSAALAPEIEMEYSGSASSDEEQYSRGFDSLGITLHPGNSYKPESNGSPRSLNHCKALVYRTLKSLPPEPVSHLKHLTLYFSNSGRRGLGGGNTIILRCQNVTDEELVGVLVHEMGHIMDTGVMEGIKAKRSGFMDGKKVVYEDDPSVEFYRLSWIDENTRRLDSKAEDFVSGYAMSDPFEDFAEAYAYYILHGNEFRALAQHNEVLQQKYDYLKTTVFHGNEYDNGEEEEVDVEQRHFDVTVLPYDMAKFFAV